MLYTEVKSPASKLSSLVLELIMNPLRPLIRAQSWLMRTCGEWKADRAAGVGNWS
jgi:hypothetical protein